MSYVIYKWHVVCFLFYLLEVRSMTNISLRNKYLNLDKKIKYVNNENYIKVDYGCYKELICLKEKTKQTLKTKGVFLRNEATGYKAKITSSTINKILYPLPKFNAYNKKYINDLNAACKLKELFEKAVYIDSLPPMKDKKRNSNELGYHHFVAPLFMNNRKFRVLITTREKRNSNILYIVSTEILIEHCCDNNKNNCISVNKLVHNIKIWNYDLEEYQIYNIDNIVCEKCEDYIYNNIETEILILH